MGRKDKPILIQNAIGARMRNARQTKGIILTKMARKVSYSKGYLSAVENGSDRPSQELLQRYEEVLELEPGQLNRI